MNILRSLAQALLLSLVSVSSYALPVLSENAGLNREMVRSANGQIVPMVIYPDRENPNRFYYMPDSAEIVRNSSGLPRLGLVGWGLNEPFSDRSGGMLNFTSRFVSSPEQSQFIQNFLASNPNATIGVIPVVESIVTLGTRVNEDGTVIPVSGTEISEQAPASGGFTIFKSLRMPPFGGNIDQQVSLSGILTGIGALAMKQAILSTGQAFTMYYCYKIQGYGPSMNANISVNYRRIYEHFRASFSVDHFFFSSQVEHETKSLSENNAVSIQILGGNAQFEDYIRNVSRDIQQRMFRPAELSLNASTPEHSSRGGFWFNATLALKHLRVEELRTETFHYESVPLVERQQCIPVTLSDLGADAVRTVSEITIPR